MTCSTHIGTTRGALAVALLVLSVAACTSDSAATASDAAAADADSSSSALELVGRLEGERFLVDKPRGPALYYWSCSSDLQAQKLVAGQWVALQDDRTFSVRAAGYYLDDTFVPAEPGLGCDVNVCTPVQNPIFVTLVNEYVRTGMKAPPPGAPAGNQPAGATVAVIETRPFHGKLRAHLRYSTEPSCNAPQVADVALDVPAQGVCCPIGSTQCSSEGPGGGWAPDTASCAPWSMIYDGAYLVKNDAHGCPVLVDDPAACCGCVPPDAGF
jgi:hypothetical protein